MPTEAIPVLLLFHFPLGLLVARALYIHILTLNINLTVHLLVPPWILSIRGWGPWSQTTKFSSSSGWQVSLGLTSFVLEVGVIITQFMAQSCEHQLR